MKIVFHEAFYAVYAGDPAADHGRMESIMRVIEPFAEVVQAIPATADQIRAVHTDSHLEWVKAQGVFDVASLAAVAPFRPRPWGLRDRVWGSSGHRGIMLQPIPPGVSAISTTWPLRLNICWIKERLRRPMSWTLIFISATGPSTSSLKVSR